MQAEIGVDVKATTNSPGTHCIGGCVGPQGSHGTESRTESIVLPRGFEYVAFQIVECCYTSKGIPPPLIERQLTR